MQYKPEPNPESVAWLIELNEEVRYASEEERKEIFKELNEDATRQFEELAIDLYSAFVLLRYKVLPPLIEAAGITLHEALENYFMDEIIDAVQTPEQFLDFSKHFFPMCKKEGMIALANERMFDKLQEILEPEADAIVELKVQLTPRSVYKQLSEFLAPYFDEVLRHPFADNEIDVEYDNGMRVTGQYRHVFHLIRMMLQRCSAPDVTKYE